MKFYLNKLRKNTLKKHLNNKHIEKSDLDWLFSNTIGIDLKKLYSIEKIGIFNYLKLKKNIFLRSKGVPAGRIVKRSYFYDFFVNINKNVLIPRKETEIIVDQVINDYRESKNKKILDLCTGSGAIAISLRKHLKAKVFASDISKKALKVAKKNAKANLVDISLIYSNMFDKIDNKFNVIISNPPYVKTGDVPSLDMEVRKFDPSIALDGGKDGLKFYRIIADNAYKYLYKNGKIYIEIDYRQADSVSKLLNSKYKNIKIVNDYTGRKRFIIATKK